MKSLPKYEPRWFASSETEEIKLTVCQPFGTERVPKLTWSRVGRGNGGQHKRFALNGVQQSIRAWVLKDSCAGRLQRRGINRVIEMILCATVVSHYELPAISSHTLRP